MFERLDCVETIEERTNPLTDLEVSPKRDIPLSIEDKKRERIERYQYCTEPLNEDLFNELRWEKLVSIDPKFLEKREYDDTLSLYSKSYRNCFVWDTDQLSKLPFGEEVDKESIMMFLTQSKGLTPTQLEELLGSNPNTLVAAMTLLANNYEWSIEELISKRLEGPFVNIDNTHIAPHFLLTGQELTSFLVGRTMLVELNKVNKSEYVKELIRSIDGVICRVNQGLVKKYALELHNTVYFQELIQEGNMGILRALQTFDIDRGLRFSTYATSWIRQKQRKFILDQIKIIKEPIHIQNTINKFFRAKEKLETITSKESTIEQVYAYCKETGQQIKTDIRLVEIVFMARKISSLDAYIDQDKDSFLMDQIAEKGESLDDIVFSRTIDEMFIRADLSPREIEIIKLRCGFIPNEDPDKPEHTLSEVAKKIGITRQRVQQLDRRAMDKLKYFTKSWSTSNL